MRKMNCIQAQREAIFEEMKRDPNVIMFGEDVTYNVYGYTGGLLDAFGPLRVRDTPLSEAAYTGAGVGAAMVGMRPIVDWTMACFAYVAMDQLINMAAKTTFTYGGQYKVPVVYLGSFMYGVGAASQHADSPHPMLMNVPGLKIIAPSNAYDMYGLLKTAIRDDDPVVCFRDSLAGEGMQLPDEEYLIPLGKADIKREGTDVTIVGISNCVNLALAAAKVLEAEGISVEVVDPRTLKPLDKGTILKSIAKTGRLVAVDHGHRTCSAASEIAAIAVSEGFHSLKAPVEIVAAPDVHEPFSPALLKLMYPTAETIAAAARKTLK